MKKLISVILSAVILLSCLPLTTAFAEGTEEYSYSVLEDGTIALSKYLDYTNNGECVIPDTIDGKTVTTLNRNMFTDRNVTKVTIPATVTSIEYSVVEKAKKLQEIAVDSKNPNYKSVGGVLYSKDGTLLVAYPMAKDATSYTALSSVTRIEKKLFLIPLWKPSSLATA